MTIYFLAVSEKGVRKTKRLSAHLWHQFVLGANFCERYALPVMTFESEDADFIDFVADMAQHKLNQPRPMLQVN